MALSLIPVCSGSSEASPGEKTFMKSEYLVEMEVGASFAINAAICILQKGWTSLFWILLGLLKEATWTIKISCPGFRAAAANSFFSTSSTRLVVEKASAIVYDFYQNSLFGKSASVPLRIRESMLRTTSGLTFATKKIFLKNLILLAWSVTEKAAITIP